jgi:ParB family chromosome partitioning protein
VNTRIHDLPLDLVVVGERLRQVDPAWVEFLAGSMRERGQDTPIKVQGADAEGRHRLIAGAHRLEAARQAGLRTIQAEIAEVDDRAAELLEIDENLMRRELSALDRAVFLSRRKAIYEALNPGTRRGGDRTSEQSRTRATLVGLPSFREETAQKLGLDPKSINRILKRAALPEDIRKAIAHHPAAESGRELDQLLKLAKRSADEARAAVRLMLDGDQPAPTVGAALQRLRGPVVLTKAQQAQQQLQRLQGAWAKAGTAARRQFLDFLASEKVIPELPGKAGKA